MASETQAIEEMVRNGDLSREVGEILKRVAGKNDVPISITEANARALHVLVDRSPSIWLSNLSQLVIDGQHHMLSVLLNASSRFEVWLTQSLFDSHIQTLQTSRKFREFDSSSGQFRFGPEVRRLDPTNYKAGDGTSLYDAILYGIVALMPTVSKCLEEGVLLFSVIGILTDGEDTTSRVRPDSLRRVIEYVTDTNRQIINRIVLAGVGSYDYDGIARSVGIQHVVHCASDDPKSIRAAFGLFSSATLDQGPVEQPREGYVR